MATTEQMAQSPAPDPTGTAESRQEREQARRQERKARRKKVRRIVAVVVVVLLAVPAYSLGRVLLADNTDPLGVRVVEWARHHYLGGMVNSIEQLWYSHHEPKKGGAPKGGLPAAPVPVAHVVAPATPKPVCDARHPANVVPFVASGLPNEGVWVPSGRRVGCGSVAWVTYMRPDAVHTSEVVGIARFDMRKLTATLHAGTELPGGAHWQHGARIDPSDYSRVVGAFNSGFLLDASRGGYFSEGRMVRPLVDGRASFVIYNDGHADVGLWGRDATLGLNTVSVRQNLGLLVDNGQLAPTLNADYLWGGTLGNKIYVWRSAVGVDKNGDLIYASGPGLNVSTLAQVMQRAGCVRAMELDINTSWVSLMLYTDNGSGGVVPWKLLPSMQRPADRYLVMGTRDFFELDAR